MNSYIFGKLCFIPALSLGRKDAHLWELVLHPCTFFGMDWRSGAEGSSCLGAGKGKKWARLCRTLHGQGHCSPFEKIFWNPQGSAFCHARPRRPAREVPQERLQFHVGKTRLAEFPLRFLPERPGTSKPIFSLPFKLRIRQGASPWRTNLFHGRRNGSKIFSHPHKLTFWVPADPKLHHTVTTGIFCDRHGIDRAEVAWIEISGPP